MSLIFFDIDGTLTSDHIWKGLMAWFQTQKRKQGVHRAYLLVHYPLYFARKARLISEMTFRTRWAGDLGWYLRGESLSEVPKIGQWVAETYLQPTWRPRVVARLKEHLAQNDTVILVSAAPDPLVKAIAQHLGTPHGIGSQFEVQNGRYSGRPLPPLCLGADKLARIRAYLQVNHLSESWAGSRAYADSITDLDLLEAAEQPVAVHPDEALRARAAAQGWEIIS